MEIEITAYQAIDSIELEEACIIAINAMAAHGSDRKQILIIANVMILAKQETARHFRKREQDLDAGENSGKE
jgi:hypothetical protein